MFIDGTTGPMEQPIQPHANPLDLLARFAAGQACPYEQGFLSRNQDTFFNVNMRVERIAADGSYTEAAVIKKRTMEPLTEAGQAFVDQLRQLAASGQGGLLDKELISKDIEDFRVTNPRLRLLREKSVDELPQGFFNTRGTGGRQVAKILFPGVRIMHMPTVAATRPLTASEIILRTDGSNDNLIHALEKVAPAIGASSYLEAYGAIAPLYKPGHTSEATAQGIRQVTKDSLVPILLGMVEFDRIERLPREGRLKAKASILRRTFGHIASGKDAR